MFPLVPLYKLRSVVTKRSYNSSSTKGSKRRRSSKRRKRGAQRITELFYTLSSASSQRVRGPFTARARRGLPPKPSKEVVFQVPRKEPEHRSLCYQSRTRVRIHDSALNHLSPLHHYCRIPPTKKDVSSIVSLFPLPETSVRSETARKRHRRTYTVSLAIAHMATAMSALRSTSGSRPATARTPVFGLGV